jgi:hypothetical protein
MLKSRDGTQGRLYSEGRRTMRQGKEPWREPLWVSLALFLFAMTLYLVGNLFFGSR